MGKGQFISQMSYKHQNVNFIGVDMYDELIRRASGDAMSGLRMVSIPAEFEAGTV